MKILTALIFAFAASANAQIIDEGPIRPPDKTDEYVRGQVLAGPHPGKTVEFLKTIRGNGGGSYKKVGNLDVYVVKVPRGLEKKFAEKLKAHPSVRFIELDRIMYPDAVPNDQYWSLQWHLPKIGAPTAWLTTSGAGVVVAVLDSGVQATHPDLVGQLVPGWNFYGNNSDTGDVCGHGTSTVGVIVELTNNLKGGAAVASGAKVMPLKIADGTSCYTYWSAVAAAISYAADHKARVVSWSWSGASVYGQTILTAAKYLRDHGGVLFVAAGNTGAVDNTPPNDLFTTVAATEKTDVRSTWSTFGPFVDIAAPGASIITTRIGSTYCNCSGTSFATPIVASVAAMMIAAHPAITPAQIQSLLYTTAVDLGTPGKDVYYGWGRVNAAAAVAAAAALP